MKKLLVIAIALSSILIYLGRNTLIDRQLSDATKKALLMEGSSYPHLEAPLEAFTVDNTSSSSRSMQEDSSIVKRGIMRRRSSFFVEMQRAGIPPGEISNAVKACRKLFNLRRVRPGQKYLVYLSSQGTLDSLHYYINSDNILRIRRRENKFIAALDTVPYAITYQVTRGIIEHSLFASLNKEGADPELASSLAVIFGWVIDFFKDIRRGDNYAILYERKNYEDGRSMIGNILAACMKTRGKVFYAFRFKRKNGGWGYYDLKGKSLEKTLLRAPLKFTRITSSFRFKRYHPVSKTYRPHLGVDYAAPYGTPIHATGDGVVIAAMRNRANGNYIKIRHNRTYTTYYLHLSRFAKGIKKGKRVRQGQVIGYVGSTGIATGSHLDYRIKVNGRFVNPRTIKLPSKTPIPPKEFLAYKKRRDARLTRIIAAPGEEKGGSTYLVEKPVYLKSTRMEMLF